MSGGSDVPDDLRAILEAQSSWKPFPTPAFAKLAVLPPIGAPPPRTTSTSTPTLLKSVLSNSVARSRPATTTGSRPPTTSIGYSVLPKISNIHPPHEATSYSAEVSEPIVEPSTSEEWNPPPVNPLPQTDDPATSSNQPNQPESRLVTPLYPIPRSNIGYNINLNDIDENEVLRPSSVTSTTLGNIDDDDFDKLIVKLPETFSEFRDIGVELDKISLEIIDQMLLNCSNIDENQSGFLSMSSVLHAIKDTLPFDLETANLFSWHRFLEWLAEPEQLFSYNDLFQTLKDDKQSREAIIHLSEVLDSDDNGSIFTQLPSRPTSSQAQREKGRAQLLIDLEEILDQNPEIDMKRMKTATDKKIIEVEEFRTLFQIYGLAEHFNAMEQRIIDCFTTHDKMFCFSAFVGCLDQMSPSISRRFESPALPAQPHSSISSSTSRHLHDKPYQHNLDDSGVALDASFSSSYHEHLDFRKEADAVSDADFILQLQNPTAKKFENMKIGKDS